MFYVQWNVKYNALYLDEVLNGLTGVVLGRCELCRILETNIFETQGIIVFKAGTIKVVV